MGPGWEVGAGKGGEKRNGLIEHKNQVKKRGGPKYQSRDVGTFRVLDTSYMFDEQYDPHIWQTRT